MIEIKNLAKSFKEKVIFKGLNLSLPDTGLFILTGKNGSGKTTLMNIISGIDTDFKGSLLFNSKPINKSNSNSYHESQVRQVFQTPLLIDTMTVGENLLFPFKDKDQAKGDELLTKVGLRAMKDERVSQLSAGERQRLMIAIAIYVKTPILLCDEITSNLDVENSELVFNIVKEISKDTLVIYSTHDDMDTSKENCIEINEYHEVEVKNRKKPEGNVTSKNDFHFTSGLQLFKTVFKNNSVAIILLSLLMLVAGIISTGYISLSDGFKDITDLSAQYVKDYYTVVSLSEEDAKMVGLTDDDACHYISVQYDINSSDEDAKYYEKSSNFAFIVNDNNYTLLEGNYPSSQTELCISSYQADYYIKNKLPSGSSYSDILGKTITDEGFIPYTVSGVYKPAFKDNEEIARQQIDKVYRSELLFNNYAPYGYKDIDPMYYKGAYYYVDRISINDLKRCTSISTNLIVSNDDSGTFNKSKVEAQLQLYKVISYTLVFVEAVLFVVLLNFVYLKEKNSLSYSRLLGVSKKSLFELTVLLASSIWGLISVISMSLIPLFSTKFTTELNATIIGKDMAFFNFSNLTWILLVAVFLLGEGFQLIRFRTLLSNNLINIALKSVKDSDN